MLKLKKGAVTGGLSCGKSSVCRFLKGLGAYVVSADEIVHQLLSPKTDLGQKVINLIGSDILINDQIDRSEIAKKVFNHPKLLKSLEEILHPAVAKEIEKQYLETKNKGLAPLFIAEIPLLFEKEGEKNYDFTIAVIADEKSCKKRFIESTAYDVDEYDKRAARQLTMKEKAEKADYVIHNNGSLEDLKNEVTKLFTNLTQ